MAGLTTAGDSGEKEAGAENRVILSNIVVFGSPGIFLFVCKSLLHISVGTVLGINLE